MTKQELRQLIRQRKQLHSVDESVVVTARLRRDPHYTHARTLLLYSALPDEVQTQPLLDELLSQGKTILLPRVGHRLGRGKGYYDRFLTLIPDVYKIGMCFSWQMADNVPCAPHDIKMDAVIY